MKAAGERLTVAVVDLYTLSCEAMEQAGEAACENWYMNLPANTYERYPEGHKDNSHLHYRGAVFYAGLIARGLKELGGIYADLLLDSVREKE